MNINDLIHRKSIKLPNGFTVSIQASALHYSSPKVNGLPLEEYDAVEIGIGYGQSLINPWVIEVLMGKPWLKYFHNSEATVGGYIPRDIWPEIVKDITNLRAANHADNNLAFLMDIL